jgi:hypothetical protein
MVISKDQLLANDNISEMAFNKTRKDIEKLFDQAIEKGLFRTGDLPEYSIRLLVPLVNGKGEIPTDYLSRKGKKRTGHGFSTTREKIKSKKDLKRIRNASSEYKLKKKELRGKSKPRKFF